MPAIPIADSRAPIVVGISATSSAIRVVTETSVPAKSANGRSDMTTNMKTSVRAASRMPSAISFGVLRRSAPSTRAIIRSRNDFPGSWVISTTIRSESTLVLPVTALRSPPASRITGADSPVIADSSTEAMPSITVPSPGIASPASTTTTSPRTSSEDGFVAAVAKLRHGLGAHRPQGVRLGLAAALRQRLGGVREHHREPEPERDAEREPGGLVAAAERGAAEHLDQPGHGGDHGADLDHEHHRVADLHPRVELLQRLDQRRPHDLGIEERAGLVLGHLRGLLVECEVELEHVHAGLAEQAEEAAVGVVGDQARHLRQRQVADRGDPVRLDPGVGLGDVRIDPRRGLRDRVDRDVGGGQARVVAAG